VSVALVMQHAKRLRHIVICDLSGSTIFLHIFSLRQDVLKKIIEHEMCVLIFSATSV
jgi:hypothetical protein